MLEIEFAELSDCGPIRQNNEDFLGYAPRDDARLARTRGWLFTVCDGVGGQAHGEVAARLTVETLLEQFEHWEAGSNPSTALPAAIQAANTRVYDEGNGAMATTVVACALRFDRATIAHVGDSRCYLVRHGRALALTRDHTWAAEQARLGLLDESAARRSPIGNVLSRSVGVNLFVQPEVCVHNVIAGDILLLCSDGLHAAVPNDELGRLASDREGLAAGAEKLIRLANQSDCGDNVSVQLIRIKSTEAVGMYRGRPYRL